MRPSETVRAVPSVGLTVLQGPTGTLAELSTGRACCHWLKNLTRQRRPTLQQRLFQQPVRRWWFTAAGIEGLRDRPHTGRPSRLTEGQMAAFRAVVLRGPEIEKDGVSSWTAKDLCRIVEARYQVSYSENGMLKLLHSLDLSWQKTRPVHPKSDPRAQADFKKNFAT